MQRGQVVRAGSNDAVAAVDVADEGMEAGVDEIAGLAQRSRVLVEEIPH